MNSRLIGENEHKAFDAFIEKAVKGHFLQSYAWGNVKGLTNWLPLRLVIEEDGKIIAAISLLKRKLPFLGYSLFYTPRGPVINDIKDEKTMDFIWQAVAKLAKEHKAMILKIDPDISEQNQEFVDYFQRAGFKRVGGSEGFEGTQPRFVFRLDISPSEDELLANMHNKTRYNLRLAVKKGVTIREASSKEDLDVFYQVLAETAKRDKFLIRNKQYFEIIWQEMVAKGKAKIFLGEFEGKVIAGTLLMLCGAKAWYLYGASSNAHRNVMPNYLIQWHMIKWAKANGCTMYDFRGVPGELTEDNPLYGLYRFKKGFNGEFIGFIGEYDLVFVPFVYKLWNLAEPIYYKLIRKWIRIKKKIKG